MSELDLEGSDVLEALAAIGKVDDFLEAVDADDFARAKKLMKKAGVDDKTIAWVLDQMNV
ncbi:MAG: hypothetical protein KF681_17880 [Bdellovibrionaceae bacterium]|nr:hypothetical protein [Pseudobdellovibrionaceae bacterium]